MGDCPNSECHEMVQKHDRTLYGNGRDGLTTTINEKANKTCLNKYARRMSTTMKVFLFGAALSMAATAVKVWSQQEVNAHIFAKKEIIQKHSERLIALEKITETTQRDIGEIKQNVQRMVDSNRDFKKDLDKRLEEIKKLIKNRR